MQAIPSSYILSKTFQYNNERVYIYTDGENYIFVAGEVLPDGEMMWQTMSQPVRIGNVPY